MSSLPRNFAVTDLDAWMLRDRYRSPALASTRCCCVERARGSYVRVSLMVGREGGEGEAQERGLKVHPQEIGGHVPLSPCRPTTKEPPRPTKQANRGCTGLQCPCWRQRMPNQSMLRQSMPSETTSRACGPLHSGTQSTDKAVRISLCAWPPGSHVRLSRSTFERPESSDLGLRR